MASDVAIQAIAFHPDGSFDISYAEQRDITPNVVMVRQVMATQGVLDDMVQEVLDSVKDLLDAALERMADAPSKISRR